jgi:hypothetical protein
MPLDVLREFAERYGLPLRFGDRFGKAAKYFESQRLPLPPHNQRLWPFPAERPSGFGHGSYEIIALSRLDPEASEAVVALAFAVDLDVYTRDMARHDSQT